MKYFIVKNAKNINVDIVKKNLSLKMRKKYFNILGKNMIKIAKYFEMKINL